MSRPRRDAGEIQSVIMRVALWTSTFVWALTCRPAPRRETSTLALSAPYNYKFGWAQPCKQRDASRDPMLLGCTQLESTSPGDRVTCSACREANPGIEGCSPPPGSVVVNGKTYLDQRSADQEVRFMVEQRARDLHAPACYMCCALWRYSDGPPREVRDTRGFWVCHSCSHSAASRARPM